MVRKCHSRENAVAGGMLIVNLRLYKKIRLRVTTVCHSKRRFPAISLKKPCRNAVLEVYYKDSEFNNLE